MEERGGEMREEEEMRRGRDERENLRDVGKLRQALAHHIRLQ